MTINFINETDEEEIHDFDRGIISKNVVHRLKSSVQDAYRSLDESPLILAVESRQGHLVQKMLEIGILNICQCTNLNSIFNFARTYLRDLAKYILMSDLMLPIEQENFKKNLEIAQRKRKCHETDDEGYTLVPKAVAFKN